MARHLLLRVVGPSRFQDGIDDGEEFAPHSHEGVHLLLAGGGAPQEVVPVGRDRPDGLDSEHPHHSAYIGVTCMAHAWVLQAEAPALDGLRTPAEVREELFEGDL